MNYWKCNNWKKDDITTYFPQKGLRLRIEPMVDAEVRRACLEFAQWIRTQYCFPIRVIVYVKSDVYVKTRSGEEACCTCLRPAQKCDSPYIRLPTGDYEELLDECGKYNALASILHSMAAMLTHYFLWLNDIEFSTYEEENDAANDFAYTVIMQYLETRDHP